MEEKNKTIDMVAEKLRDRAAMLCHVFQDPTEAGWARDYARELWIGYKDAADFVSSLKESH